MQHPLAEGRRDTIYVRGTIHSASDTVPVAATVGERTNHGPPIRITQSWHMRLLHCAC